MIRVFLLSRAALPANSRISAARYSRTAARYTGAPNNNMRNKQVNQWFESLTSTDTLSIVTLPQKTVNTADWEGKTSFG